MDDTELEKLNEELELLLWNNSFGIYSKSYFKKQYTKIIDKIEQLDT